MCEGNQLLAWRKNKAVMKSGREDGRDGKEEGRKRNRKSSSRQRQQTQKRGRQNVEKGFTDDEIKNKSKRREKGTGAD